MRSMMRNLGGKLFGRHSKMFGAVSVLSVWFYEMNRNMEESVSMFPLKLWRARRTLLAL